MDQFEGDYWNCLATHVDVQLATSWQKSQAHRVSRAKFLRANRDCLQLFLSLEVASRIEECVSAGKVQPDPKDVDLMCRAGHIGRELFATESLKAEHGLYVSEVARRLCELETQNFEETERQSFRRVCSHMAEALDREVWKAFDGEDLKIEFLDDFCKAVQTNPNDVWQLSEQARLKSLAISLNKVKRYPYETLLFNHAPLPNYPQAVDMPDGHLFDIRNGREFMHDRLGEGFMSLEQMQSCFRAHAEEARKLDPSFRLDEYYLLERVNELADQHCKELLLACLPNEAQQSNAAKCLVACKLLINGDVVQAQHEKTKSSLTNAVNVLQDIVDCLGPTAQEAKHFEPFLMRFLKRCENLAFCDIEDMDPGDCSCTRTFTVFAQEAISATYDACKKTKGRYARPREDQDAPNIQVGLRP